MTNEEVMAELRSTSRLNKARAIKAVIEELCEHEGAEGFSEGTHDRVAALYERLGMEP